MLKMRFIARKSTNELNPLQHTPLPFFLETVVLAFTPSHRLEICSFNAGGSHMKQDLAL